MIAQRRDQFRGHQLHRAGLVQRLPEILLKFVRGGALDRQAHAHAAGEGEELVGSQAFEEPSVAGEHDGEQDVRIELGGTQQAQLGENGRQHLLRLVDDEHRPRQRGIDVGLPALAQHLGAGPAVVGTQFDAEQVAHLAIEIGEIGLGPAAHADLDVTLLGEPLGENPQGDRLAGAGRAGDEGEAAFADQLLDAPAERRAIGSPLALPFRQKQSSPSAPCRLVSRRAAGKHVAVRNEGKDEVRGVEAAELIGRRVKLFGLGRIGITRWPRE